MTHPEKRNAPAGNRGTSKQVRADLTNTPSLTDPVDEVTAQLAVHGVYVAVVHVRTENGAPRWSRRIYLSLHSAQKAVDRAHMRGHRAYVVLCQLHATGIRTGGPL